MKHYSYGHITCTVVTEYLMYRRPSLMTSDTSIIPVEHVRVKWLLSTRTKARQTNSRG